MIGVLIAHSGLIGFTRAVINRDGLIKTSQFSSKISRSKNLFRLQQILKKIAVYRHKTPKGNIMMMKTQWYEEARLVLLSSNTMDCVPNIEHTNFHPKK
jgi:hypothetical protein